MPEHKKARTHAEPGPGGPPTEEVAAEREDVESLKNQLDEERQKAETYLTNWQRIQADFVNYKRRTEQERGDATKFSNVMLILNLLPAVDDLERALNTVPTNLAGLTWFEGLRLIYRKLMASLESQGLQAIDAEGKDFDPNLHEAVMHSEGEEGKVLQELQRGYRLHDRVIRPAMVRVGSSAAGEGQEPGQQQDQEREG
ncbi:MAG: nucleotide exchange factor GrpE [Dehalococcoidia bacterium]|nr:nucleotide exchange factor GrpE [Dehalococcoidia bacterium]